MPPQWHPEALRAAQAWEWLGGWRPDLLPMYLALADDHPDPELLIDLLLFIRKQAHG